MNSKSIGQARTQIPHAIHFVATSRSADFTHTPNGQTSAHFPQPVHFFLSIMYTPFAFCVIACSGQFFAHFPHCTHTFGRTTPALFIAIRTIDTAGSIRL
jgi:hypothetical protein